MKHCALRDPQMSRNPKKNSEQPLQAVSCSTGWTPRFGDLGEGGSTLGIPRMIECRREGIQCRMMMRRGDATHSLILLLAILPSCISLPSPSPPGTSPRMGSPPAASPLSPITITPTPPPPSANLSPIPPAPPPGIESITKPDPGPIHPPPPLPRADVPKAAPSAIILLLLSTASAVILARKLHERVHSGVFWTWVSTQWQSNIFFLPSLLVLYYVIDSFADAAVRHYAAKNVDATLLIFIERLVKYTALASAVVALLPRIGFRPTGLQGVLASMAISIGLASQTVLSNLAAGIMLLVYRPYSIGDHVQLSSKFGIVHDITLFDTRLDTTSNIRIRIPNCEIYGKVIENWTRNHFIRIEIPITTATCHPIERVKEVLEEALDPYRSLIQGYLEEKGCEIKIAKAHQSPSGTGNGRSASEATYNEGGMLRWLVKGISRNRGVPITAWDVIRGCAYRLRRVLDRSGDGQINFTDFAMMAQSIVDSSHVFDSPSLSPKPPAALLKEVRGGVFVWAVRLWVPSPLYDRYKFEVMYSVSRSLQAAGISTTSPLDQIGGILADRIQAD